TLVHGDGHRPGGDLLDHRIPYAEVCRCSVQEDYGLPLAADTIGESDLAQRRDLGASTRVGAADRQVLRGHASAEVLTVARNVVCTCGSTLRFDEPPSSSPQTISTSAPSTANRGSTKPTDIQLPMLTVYPQELKKPTTSPSLSTLS